MASPVIIKSATATGAGGATGDSPTLLEAALRASVTGRVSFDDGTRALYSTDASNYRQIPIGVVLPRSVDDVVAAMASCAAKGAPVLMRGGGTAMAGQSTNTAVVIDCSRHLNRIAWLDPERRRARVEPGCVLDTLRDRARPHGLTFGPDPATHNHCTFGGMIGNNSCGTHSMMAGRTSDNVGCLEVLTYDGLRMWVGPTSDDELAAIIAGGGRRAEIYAGMARIRDVYGDEIRRRYPDIPRRVAGYNLDDLLPEKGFNVARALVGTEGTCVAVLSAELVLVPDPPERAMVVLGYPDVGAAGDAVPLLLRHHPIGLEGFGHQLVADTKAEHLFLPSLSLLPPGRAWLIVELGGTSADEVMGRAADMIDEVGRGEGAPSTRLVEDPAQVARVWALREAGIGVTARLPDGTRTWTGWEDSAVPPSRLGDYLRDLLALYARHGYHAALYGHFGQACIHNRLDLDLTSVDGIARYRTFAQEAADLCVSYGGSISGEHGDGQSRAELLPRMYGPDLVRAFEEFKGLWDPGNKMNPGKVVHPARIDEHLRLGAHYRPANPSTFFAFTNDNGSIAQAALRCVGAGKCRKEDGGTMCPSYMATREEKDSTRGRARLLFEMLQGDVITDGWRSEAVRDALDLCLACKGCKSECPVNVDMATYKAEFLAHHYRWRLRPAAHYSMGWLPLAARAASRAPRLLNVATHTPGLDSALKWLGGIAYERDFPRFAHQSFTDWFRARPASVPAGGPPVLLWPDTFNNYFHPNVGRAALSVLESAGFRVEIPDRPLCCGLTWISTGQLGMAKRMLRRSVDALAPALEAGLPVVGLEPSCTAVFRSDLADLLPQDEGAKRLAAQTLTLAELLANRAPDWDPPRRDCEAIIQGHCHHKAVLGMEPDTALLARAGVDAEVLDSGCCGLAGNFGFERGHYEVSMACAERVLLPAVRAAGPAKLVIADGFSCRTQIEQATGRQALHLAEVLDPGA